MRDLRPDDHIADLQPPTTKLGADRISQAMRDAPLPKNFNAKLSQQEKDFIGICFEGGLVPTREQQIEAAERAGYFLPPRDRFRPVRRLMQKPSVKRVFSRRIRAIMQKSDISVSELITEIHAVATADLTEILSYEYKKAPLLDADGNAVLDEEGAPVMVETDELIVYLTPSHELSPIERAALKSFEWDGEKNKWKVTMHDKLRAQQLLAELLSSGAAEGGKQSLAEFAAESVKNRAEAKRDELAEVDIGPLDIDPTKRKGDENHAG